MKRTHVLFFLGLLMSVQAVTAAEKPAQNAPAARPLPRDLEIELALSALPAHLRDAATVYVLGGSGKFEIAREGSNGFHTFVARNDPNAFRGAWPFTEYRDDILLPISFDDAGSRAHMRVFFDMAEMQASGTPPAEMKEVVTRRYESGQYAAPDRAGISYMLAPIFRTYVNPDQTDAVATMNVPHYMFYAPDVSNEDIGGKFQSEHPFMLNESPSPHGYIIQVAGQAEKAAINKEYAEMMDRLCRYREVYCLQ